MGVLKLQPKRRAKGGPVCNPSLTKILPFVFRLERIPEDTANYKSSNTLIFCRGIVLYLDFL